jgi:hypothetical protein
MMDAQCLVLGLHLCVDDLRDGVWAAACSALGPFYKQDSDRSSSENQNKGGLCIIPKLEV